MERGGKESRRAQKGGAKKQTRGNRNEQEKRAEGRRERPYSSGSGKEQLGQTSNSILEFCSSASHNHNTFLSCLASTFSNTALNSSFRLQGFDVNAAFSNQASHMSIFDKNAKSLGGGREVRLLKLLLCHGVGGEGEGRRIGKTVPTSDQLVNNTWRGPNANMGFSLLNLFLLFGGITSLFSVFLYVLMPGGTVKYFGGTTSPSAEFWVRLPHDR